MTRRNKTGTTIGETIEKLHNALRDYIEATYHISNETLVKKRRKLLKEPGVIHQVPYLESTPRYKAGKSFNCLGLDDATIEVLSAVSKKDGDLPLLIHDPPYQHQALSAKLSLVDKRSLIVITGTGSGKTECFLLPILGKLAREAKDKGDNFGKTPAMRAMVLYPMNALVNDQLGRLRLLFGDPRIVKKFIDWSGRPVRFARYTSRTPYPGVRNKFKDQRRLASIGNYYVENMKAANEPESSEQKRAKALVEELKKRGKWPAKSDLIAWYGSGRWQDPRTGEFRRCVTLPEDSELLTRHEVHTAPPDILVTNYSMLEYMLMRPLEQPIFDFTRNWLRENPQERFLLVVDEAHLYRGSAGAEVALLIRRLRMRLDIPPERLQVICTSASFEDSDHASEFAAQLAGKRGDDFETVTGELDYRNDASKGTAQDAEALAAIDLRAFYDAETDEERVFLISEFLEYRGIESPSRQLGQVLYDSLNFFPPMAKLINLTMTKANQVDMLGEELFEEVPRGNASKAATNLIALGSMAKKNPAEPSLLPCRVHSFYRGLAGLWVCMDTQCECAELPRQPGRPAGKLFSQPRDKCDCGARVLELYTCRNCGTAYGRAYTSDIDEPDFLWSESGEILRTLAGQFGELLPIDLLLEDPVFAEEVEPAEYDLITGRLNPRQLSSRNRMVYLRKYRSDSGEFNPCAVCGQSAAFGGTYVQDHQTKGDQPFQALITEQVQTQYPSTSRATKLAPLRGRKVLIFSDSRQMAARLAPNIQRYSTQDVVRPLIVYGYKRLEECLGQPERKYLSLEHLYLGVLTAAAELEVRLRPELKSGESFRDQDDVEQGIRDGVLESGGNLLLEFGSLSPPEFLLRVIVSSITDPHYGLESLAFASLAERAGLSSRIGELPEVPGRASSNDEKIALARIWLRCWLRSGFWLSSMPPAWQSLDVRTHSGHFKSMDKFLSDENNARKTFRKEWVPRLLELFSEEVSQRKFRLLGKNLSLDIAGDWSYCQVCRTTQRPFSRSKKCVNCGREEALPIDPDNDTVFGVRKGYYRKGTLGVLNSPPKTPLSFIAAEHTAQLNAAQEAEVFSKAEEYELLFQDVDLGSEDPAIDILSCTTTMEVGIDIGALSGVSLRNMPPSRANYQQRAGRAGRRGNAVATVTAFGSASSHDEHYFTHPDQMIRGEVNDPTLTLNNPDIVRRHITAYLLQRYHRARLPADALQAQPNLFAVLGDVNDFKNPDSSLNFADLGEWLRSNEDNLRQDVKRWLPKEIDPEDLERLLAELVEKTLESIGSAIEHLDGSDNDDVAASDGKQAEEDLVSGNPISENLIERLLYKGVLPRYAFPTDVATFYVFDQGRSTSYRPEFLFKPSQNLSVALSQYAPGKEIWIDGRLWTSGAVYSPMPGELRGSWRDKHLYYECGECGYAKKVLFKEELVGEKRDCEACGSAETLGPSSYWLRPPGFAHPVNKEPETSQEGQPVSSYATRAKLTTNGPTDQSEWERFNSRLRAYRMRGYLLVTNRGLEEKGYDYCTKCGLIEPTALNSGKVLGEHQKPYPARNANCVGGTAKKGIMLGTDFISDVFLISISVEQSIILRPSLLSTNVALFTVGEALSKAACAKLELEEDELQAGYRPALTSAGREGSEAEIYLYDTLPGGAGFSQQVFGLGLSVFEEALKILEECPDNCDRSCYRCLRSYKNKFEHDLLDRHVGASLLRFLVHGNLPVLDAVRLSSSADLLFEDLQRQKLANVIVERNRIMTPTGFDKEVEAPIYVVNRENSSELIIALHGPLTPGHIQDADLRELESKSSGIHVLPCDEMLVRRNLPAVTKELISEIKGIEKNPG